MTLTPAMNRGATPRERFEADTREVRPAQTDAGLPLDLLYTPEHIESLDYDRDLGYPGQYPFTRGAYPTMYRGRRWTYRQYSGMATAEETNERYQYLLARGQTALSVAFDLPTQLGYDSDHPLAVDEVGRIGVAIDTVDDMDRLFDRIDLERVSVNFTINATASIILALYLAVARRRGLALNRLAGTVQNDILKEFLARNTYIYPPAPSLQLCCDIIEHCAGALPRFNPISVTGFHIREARASAVQEIAFTLGAACVYTDEMLRRGFDIDDFAARLSFHFATTPSFFEEIAKLRAARRMWARLVRDRYGARQERSCVMRFFSGGAGAWLAHQEPLNNIVRTTVECLAAVLAGAQSIHVMAFDEALGIPTEESARIALRTQQILAEETDIAEVVDPLGGSYFVESLTNRLEDAIRALMAEIEELGGYLRALEAQHLQRAVLDRAYEQELQLQRGTRPIVGQNVYVDEEVSGTIPALQDVPAVAPEQIARLQAFRATRDAGRVHRALGDLRRDAESGRNIMPALIEAAESGATLGEMADEFRAVFGEWRPQS
jgi:methylmalonyl-CoA mutase, N-terminal domain